jgi:hypothetical protein
MKSANYTDMKLMGLAAKISKFAVFPYKDFLRMQENLKDYYDLRDLRKAKADPRNQQDRRFDDVAKELGLKKKITKKRADFR